MKQRKGRIIIKQVKNCKAKNLILHTKKNRSKNITIYNDAV